ncbi:MAG: hypothetical protein U0270_06120 [Labilithrix sp.]
MRSRTIAGVLATGLFACSSFGGESSATKDAGASDGGSTSASSSSSSSSGSSSSGSTADWPPGPSGVGVSCAARPAKPKLCEDFDNGSVPPLVKQGNGALSLESPGSGSTGRCLRAAMTTTDKEGLAFVQQAVGLANEIIWTYDLKLTADIVFDMELGELNLPFDNDECALQLHFDPSNKQLTLYEFCSNGDDVERGFVTLPDVPGQWVNVWIDAHLDTKKFSMTVTPENAPAITSAGSIAHAMPSSAASVRVGCTYGPSKTQPFSLYFDNFAAYAR